MFLLLNSYHTHETGFFVFLFFTIISCLLHSGNKKNTYSTLHKIYFRWVRFLRKIIFKLNHTDCARSRVWGKLKSLNKFHWYMMCNIKWYKKVFSVLHPSKSSKRIVAFNFMKSDLFSDINVFFNIRIRLDLIVVSKSFVCLISGREALSYPSLYTLTQRTS